MCQVENRFAILSFTIGRDSVLLSETRDARLCPCQSRRGLMPQQPHNTSNLLVRESLSELLDDLRRLSTRSPSRFTGSPEWNGQLGVNAPCPMDNGAYHPILIVPRDDDLPNETSHDSLLDCHVGVGVGPDTLKLGCYFQEVVFCAGLFMHFLLLQLCPSLFQFVEFLQGDVPTALQLLCHDTVLGVDRIVLPVCALCLEPRRIESASCLLRSSRTAIGTMAPAQMPSASSQPRAITQQETFTRQAF